MSSSQIQSITQVPYQFQLVMFVVLGIWSQFGDETALFLPFAESLPRSAAGLEFVGETIAKVTGRSFYGI